MMRAQVEKSLNKDLSHSLEEIKRALKSEEFDIALLSVDPRFEVEKISRAFRDIFGSKRYVAFHANSSFVDEEVVEGGVSALFLTFEKKKTKVKIFSKNGIDRYTKKDVEDTANYLRKHRKDFHIIIASLAKENFAFFLEDLSKRLDYRPVKNIIGGISSGIKIGEEVLTYQLVEDRVINNGFVILSFTNLKTAIEISLGFVPYGIRYKVTKAHRNKLYEVDGGSDFSSIIKRITRGIDHFDIRYLWYTPINILDEEDGYVATMRTIEEVNDEYVKFYGPLKNGQYFKISFATAEELIEADKKAASRLKRKLLSIEVVFNFSCVARQYVLEDRQAEEAKWYRSILGAPLFGFFTFGEIGPDRMYKRLKLYNETSLLLGMKEL